MLTNDLLPADSLESFLQSLFISFQIFPVNFASPDILPTWLSSMPPKSLKSPYKNRASSVLDKKYCVYLVLGSSITFPQVLPSHLYKVIVLVGPEARSVKTHIVLSSVINCETNSPFTAFSNPGAIKLQPPNCLRSI